MTPLEEAVARIIDPEAMASDLDISFDGVSNFSMRRKKAKEIARAILALPEIVKMQEALEQVEAAERDLQSFYDNPRVVGYRNPESLRCWLSAKLRPAFDVVRAALQPLKKEAK